MILLDALHFVCMPVGQVKPKNNLPEAIAACFGQALILNPCKLFITINNQTEICLLVE